jgi:hypothetical protein
LTIFRIGKEHGPRSSQKRNFKTHASG